MSFNIFNISLNSKAALLLVAAIFTEVSYAGNTDKHLLAKGMWRDSTTDLIWMRCPAGQVWAGDVCKGEAIRMGWWGLMRIADKATFAGQSDWRLPTFNELKTLIGKTGRYSSGILFNGDNANDGCFISSSLNDWKLDDGREVHDIHTIVLGTEFERVDDTRDPRRVYNSCNWSKSYQDYNARLVRAGNPDGTFEASLAAVDGDPEEQEYLKERERIANQRLAWESKKADERRQATAEQQKQARLNSELALPPQAMYLQAGKYVRQGNSSDAKQLYETLIDKYPNHPLAIKANDQLQSMSTSTNSSRSSNMVCSHLYIGKAVSYKGCGALWCTTVEGVITGIGNGVATMKVTGSEYNGDVIEKSCSKF